MATRLRVAGTTLAAVLVAIPAAAGAIDVGDLIYVTKGSSRFTYDDGAATRTGGAFLLHNNSNPAMSPFETFCIEFTETVRSTNDLASPNLYQVNNITNAAAAGGRSGQDNPPANDRDSLSDLTKYIYWKYRGGASGWTGREVQEAIWFIEGELNAGDALSDGVPPLPNAKAIYDQALDFLDLNNNGVLDVGETFSVPGVTVSALNLKKCYTEGGVTRCTDENAQDLLVMNQVPEPASSLFLLGSGLLGMAAWRRWQARRL